MNFKRRLQYKSSALSLNVRPHKVAEGAKWLVSNGDLYKEEGITFNDPWLEGISLVDDCNEFSESSENVESNAAKIDYNTDCQTQQTTDNEDDWSEDKVEIPADAMLTAPYFVTDNEQQYILNIALAVDLLVYLEKSTLKN